MNMHAAPDPVEELPLYVPHKKIYPQSVKGRFRNIKWALLGLCLSVYYFLPFVRWDRGPGAPSQAVLIDFPGRRFYFFGIEIWPQEVYYLTGLLILAALILFLMNSVAGRLWCGYLCPQTVWTDLFYAVERWVEGDRRERIKKDHDKLTAWRVGELALKHWLWLMIAWWTGGAWVLYFADAPTLIKSIATGQAPFVAYLWIGILTFTTYSLAGFMREQVCVYMCPWPRIQAALTDEWALNVTYRYDRGEPRAHVKEAKKLKAEGKPAGDCVDCGQCVAVCPTGVDIRNGAQLDCIQCGLCIDACDRVMEKVGRPTGLIGYDTDDNCQRRERGEAPVFRPLRPRTLIYVGAIVLVGAVMTWSLVNRITTSVSVLHDRNPLFVALSDGAVRNGYTLRVLNKQATERTFALTVDGVPSPRLEVIGIEAADGPPLIATGADTTRELRVLVAVPAAAVATIERSSGVTFRITDVDGGGEASVADHFIAR
ncbi:cytochrome c oxidase accessory protein CcoG [Blastochloris viridis]|uniref:Cytochrome c oxidase accessory protein CcoG n=2 Tax=Blastochloris viridis TaxID=1079 RepID=A0A0P0JF02_BLAVI|nr:cytochrome c oxidase accessory protein CcoG [Blastochloris viridis]ALK10640.1 Ubp3 associated protein Bre5 [Blastochloris viridis]CUU43303.1 cytochrome c oxidase accessory protein CcoG [Blastochloris viridis]